MSSIAFDATPNGQYVIVAFMGLPYLLVYNANHEHIHTLRLVGEPINDHANNYTMSRLGVRGTGLRILILRVHILNDEYMAVPLRDTWHFIRFARDGSFMHVGAARLMHSGQPDAEAVFATSQAQLHGEHL